MNKKTIISKSKDTILKLKVLAKKKESVRNKLAVTAKEKESVRSKLVVTAEKLAATAKEKENIRNKLVVTAEKLAATAKEKESVRSKLAVTARALKLKAKQLATTAREKEGIRSKLAVTAAALKLKAKNLATTAREKESVRHRLVATAKKLAATANEKEYVRRKLVVTANEKESVRNRLVVTARALKLKAKNLAAIAKEKESIKRKLEITAKNLATFAKEKESVRHRLIATAEKLAATAKEKESVRSKLVVTARALKLKAKNLAATAKEKESIRRKLVVTAENLAATAKEREDVRNRLAATAKNLATLAKEKESIRRKLVVTAKDLARAKAKDEAMLASIGDGLVATDKDGKIILVNSAFEKMLGWNESEVKGKSLSKILQTTDALGKEILESERLFTKTLKQGISTTTTINTATTTYKRKNGTTFPVAVTVSPIVIDAAIFGAVEVFRDITREKELDRLKSEFISIASHQLRTPLTSIQWVVERFTKKEQLTPKGREYLDDIHISVKRLNELVNLLLSLSRIEAGKIGITPEPLEVIALVKSFLDETAPLQDKKGLKLVFNDYPAELTVKTDRSALRNIVQSLISNAIEYTPAGGKIDVAVQKKDNTFIIKVQDTGIGIPIAQQSHIFEKFVRASNAKLYKTDGTGIGLYIAKWSASRLGGKIWFESEENKGSTFYVELPLEFNPPKEQKPL